MPKLQGIMKVKAMRGAAGIRAALVLSSQFQAPEKHETSSSNQQL
jgi:hypothetical protein